MSKKNSTSRLSADAQRTVERTAALRVEFGAMSTADLRLHLNAYSQAVGMAYSPIAAERYLEKIHAIEGVLHERMEAAAAMVEEAFAAEAEEEDAAISEAPQVRAQVPAPRPAKAQPSQATPKKSAAEVCRVRQMRAFYGAAKRAGLCTKDVLGMTWALAKYLGCTVPSRGNLSGGQWAEATAALELGLIVW